MLYETNGCGGAHDTQSSYYENQGASNNAGASPDGVHCDCVLCVCVCACSMQLCTKFESVVEVDMHEVVNLVQLEITKKQCNSG